MKKMELPMGAPQQKVSKNDLLSNPDFPVNLLILESELAGM
jgi:hypothetical protein